MADHINDGGWAFPHSYHPGMTLRDYFAAQAIAGFLRACDDSFVCADDVAAEAYKLADAMLRARKGCA